jgi:hypothetical protein
LDFGERAHKKMSRRKDSSLDFVNATADKHTVASTNTLSPRFVQLIEELHEKAGHRGVVFVDEYDRPMLDNIGSEAYPEAKRTLKASCSFDRPIQIVRCFCVFRAIQLACSTNE